jgi:hypothetical protein
MFFRPYRNQSFRISIRRKIIGNETEAVSDVTVSDDTVRARAITFSTVRDGKIVLQVEFWPDDYPAPENRRHLVEMMK